MRRLHQEAFLWRWRRRIRADEFAHFGRRSLIVEPRGILCRHRIEIGDDVLIHEGAMFSLVEHFRGRDYEPWLRIGSGTNIGGGIWFSCVGEIEIGENIQMAHNVLIADSYHEYEDPDTPIIFQPMAPPRPVRIGSGSYVGAHAAILGGAAIGENSFIGANAVVNTSVPPNSLVVGNPARVIRRFDRALGRWVEGRCAPGAEGERDDPARSSRR